MTVFEKTMVIVMLVSLCIEVVCLLIHMCNIEADTTDLLNNARALYKLLSDKRLVECTGSPYVNEDLEELKQLVARSRKYTGKVKGEEA